MPTRVRFRLEDDAADGGQETVKSVAAMRKLAEQVASLEPIEIAGHRIVGALDWGTRLPPPRRGVRVGFELLPHYDYPPDAEIHQRRATEAFAALRDSHARGEAVRVRLGGRGSRLQPAHVTRLAQMARRVVVGFTVGPPQRPAEVPLEQLSVIALRRELRRRKVGELRRLAAEAGYSDDEVREAFEQSDDPKGTVIALLVTHYAKLGGHVLEEPAPELAVPTLVRVKVLEGRQLKAAAPFNLSRHRDHDAYVEVQLLGKDGEAIPHTATPAVLNAPLRGHVSDFGGAEIRNKPRQQELREMRAFALQQICKDKGLDTTFGTGGKAELVARILDAEAATLGEAGDRRADRDAQRVHRSIEKPHRQRGFEHGRSADYVRSHRSRDEDDRSSTDVGQPDGEPDSASAQAAGYSATTFRRSAAWKSTIVHQSADPVWNETTEFRARELQPLPTVRELNLVCTVFDQAQGNTVPRQTSHVLARDQPPRLSKTTSRAERTEHSRTSSRSATDVAESDEGERQSLTKPIGVVTLPLEDIVTLPNCTYEGWLPLRPAPQDEAKAGRWQEERPRGTRRQQSSVTSNRGQNRDKDERYGNTRDLAYTTEHGEEGADDAEELRGGEFGLGELKVVVELVVPKTLPDSDDDDDEAVEKQRSARAAVNALQDVIDGSALDWRSVCKVAGKRVQLGQVLRENSPRRAVTTGRTDSIVSHKVGSRDYDRQERVELPPLLDAVVSGSVRWCKVCKIAFAPPVCPNSHAIFHYTRLVPPDVLYALQVEARLTTIRLKWAAMDPNARQERAATMLQAVVRGKMGRRRAFTEDQWRRLGLRIATHANRDRSRRLHIAGRRPPTRRWQLKWPARAQLLGADSKGLTAAVLVERAPPSKTRSQVVQIQTPGQLRPLYTFTQMTERSVMMVDFYKARETLAPEEPQLSQVYSHDRRTSTPFLRRRARALAAAAAKGDVLPAPVFCRVPMGTPPGMRFRVAVSLLAQTQPMSALGSLIRRRKQLAAELRRLQLLRPGQYRRCRVRMTQTLLHRANLCMDQVAATALQAAWRGSCRRAAVRAVCGPIVARDAANIGLAGSAHKTWSKRGSVPPMKLVLQVLAARVQKAKIESLREDVLAHKTAAQPDESLASAKAAVLLDDSLPIVTVRYWTESLLALERGSASDDIVRLVMDVGPSRRVFKACRALLLAGLPKFREELEVRGGSSHPPRRRVKLQPGDSPQTIERLISYVHGEVVRLSQNDIVAFISAARHYGARGEAYERLIRSFSELLGADNCCVLMETAGTAAIGARSMQEKRAAQRLVALCMRYILENLDSVVYSGEIVRLPEENLLVILKSEQLRVVSEGDILKLAISWVQHDVKNRAPALERIRPLIRWPNIPQSLMQEYSNDALREAQRADAERERAATTAATAKKAAELAEAVENTFSQERRDAKESRKDASAVTEIAVDEEWNAWKLSRWRVVLDVVVRYTADEGSEFVGKLQPGAQFQALEEVEIAKGCVRIRFEDCEGLSGWVSSRGQDGALMLEKLEQHAAIDSDHEVQLRWVCGLSPLILTDELALMSLLQESGAVRSVDPSSVHRISISQSDDDPVFAVRVKFIKPDANALLRRRGRRGAVTLDASDPLTLFGDRQSGESSIGTGHTDGGFSDETTKEIARLRDRLILIEPDFGDPEHMEQQYMEAIADREPDGTQQTDALDVDVAGNEDIPSSSDSVNVTDSEDGDQLAHHESRQGGAYEDPRFLPSQTFVGARPGYYFGVGQLGLGYHYDKKSPHWVEVEAQSAVDEAVASLAEWLQQRVALLQALTPLELRQVAAAAETREYQHGQAIVTEGQEGKEMFVIQKGSASVTKLGVNMGRPLTTYGPGDAFGERALLLTEPRGATVKATEPYPNVTVCLVIGQAVASNLLLKNPQIQEAMRQRAAMQAAAEKAARELLLAEKRTLQASVFVELLDGALAQRLVGDRGVAFGPAASGRNYVPLQRLQEEQAALELHNQRQEPSCAGEVWYVVSAEWWHRWVDHVNFWQHYQQPGPICNEMLLLSPQDNDQDDTGAGDTTHPAASDESSCTRQSERGLRRNPMLKEHEDYVLTCKDVWDCVVSWYGGGPPIERMSVANSSILSMVADSRKKTRQISTTFTPKNFAVEVYRLRLRVCVRAQIPVQSDASRRVGVPVAVDPQHSLSAAVESNDNSNDDTNADNASVRSGRASTDITIHGVDASRNAGQRRPVLQRARVVVGYDPPNALEQGKLTLEVGDNIEVLDSSTDFWHGRKLPKLTDIDRPGTDRPDEMWKLWTDDSLEEGRFPSTCVTLVAAAQLSDDDTIFESGGRARSTEYGKVLEVSKGTLLCEVKQQACALLGIASLAAEPPPSFSLEGEKDSALGSAERRLNGLQDVVMRAYSRALGFTAALDESLSVTDARLYDGAVLCLDVDRPASAVKPTRAALDAVDDEQMPPEAVPPSRAGLASSLEQEAPAAPGMPVQASGVDGTSIDKSTDVALHWRDAAQRGFNEVLGPLFDPTTGVAVAPPLVEDTTPIDGSVKKVKQLVTDRLRDLETEKRQAAAEEDFDRALSCKRTIASWQQHQIVWSAVEQRGVESVEKVADLVDEITGCSPNTQDKTIRRRDVTVDAGERSRRGGSQRRRGAVVEADALQDAGAASVASQAERIRLAKLRIGWPQDVLSAAGGVEELLHKAALLDVEDRPLQRAWLKLKQQREAAEAARAKAEALATAEEERRQAAIELERVDAEEEAAAGPLPAGWEKIRRGRSVYYQHIASGRQQNHRPHAIDALTPSGPQRRPAEEAAALQTKAGQALLDGDGVLALQCLRQATQLLPDDLTLQAALTRMEMLAPPPPLPEGWDDQQTPFEESELSDESEEEEWQRWLAQHDRQHTTPIEADETREQQRRRAAHKLQHKARRWLEACLETDLAEAAAASKDTPGTGAANVSSVFGAALRSGVLLCDAINTIQPGTIPRISKLKAPFPQRENITNFLSGARSLGVSESDCFDTSDLFEYRNLLQVATCVLALAQVAAEPPYNFIPSKSVS